MRNRIEIESVHLDEDDVGSGGAAFAERNGSRAFARAGRQARIRNDRYERYRPVRCTPVSFSVASTV